MAPERILNPADVDGRSDIYAVGAVGYFLLTGKAIFEGDNNLEISNQMLAATAPRATASGGAGIPAALDALIAACLEKDRERRPQTADAVIGRSIGWRCSARMDAGRRRGIVGSIARAE